MCRLRRGTLNSLLQRVAVELETQTPENIAHFQPKPWHTYGLFTSHQCAMSQQLKIAVVGATKYLQLILGLGWGSRGREGSRRLLVILPPYWLVFCSLMRHLLVSLLIGGKRKMGSSTTSSCCTPVSPASAWSFSCTRVDICVKHEQQFHHRASQDSLCQASCGNLRPGPVVVPAKF